MDARRLFNNPTYHDVVLIANGTAIQVHRCILDVVPFFDAAFRSGQNMKEGQNKVLTIALATPHTSILALVKHVYGFPDHQYLPKKIGELLQLADDCEMYACPPFLDTIWEKVTNMRDEHDDDDDDNALTEEEVVKSIEFATAHKLPITLGIEHDCRAASVSFNAAQYLIRNGGRKGNWGSSVGAYNEIYFAVMWMNHHSLLIKEGDELSSLYDPNISITPENRTKLAELAYKYELNTPATRLIIKTLVEPPEAGLGVKLALGKPVAKAAPRFKKPSPKRRVTATDSGVDD